MSSRYRYRVPSSMSLFVLSGSNAVATRLMTAHARTKPAMTQPDLYPRPRQVLMRCPCIPGHASALITAPQRGLSHAKMDPTDAQNRLRGRPSGGLFRLEQRRP